MEKAQFLKDLADRICNALPSNLQDIKKDLEKNIQGVLNNAFTKFDLVTREEFDTQTKVLARTRQKIESLEAKIKELEKMIQESSHD